MSDYIFVKGAKEHNLKNLSVRIPRNQLVVFTGLSGSGKSSLAFDTIFAEGQRRYVESLSSYARMFIGQMEKPDVEYIEGLSPAISIDQKTTSKNPRSTVGTVTEIHDYLRLLFANIGVPHCPRCGREVQETSVDQIVDSILSHEGERIVVAAPVVRAKKGEYAKQLEGYRKQGFLRVVIDGITYTLDEQLPALDKQIKHTISVVVDRMKATDQARRRLTDSVETALRLAEGIVEVTIGEETQLFNTLYSCPDCNVTLPEITPRLFSFNSPFGACPKCNGIGVRFEADPALLIPDMSKSLSDGAVAIKGLTFDAKMIRQQLVGMSEYYGFSLHTPIKDLPKSVRDMIFYGNGGEVIPMPYNSRTFSGSYQSSFEGLVPIATRRYNDTESDLMKREYERFMSELPCPQCHGDRLGREAQSVTVGGKNIVEISKLSVKDALLFFDSLALTDREAKIAHLVLKEIKARLNFLLNVGLGYLTLFRASATLSGGESQRIRLATQIGSGLEGVLYILDEPSIGLHQRDNGRLISALKRLRDLGNTLIVVEHDEETILSADHVVDIGPGAGVGGGEMVVQGTPQQVMDCEQSITGQYLKGTRFIPIPSERKAPDGRYLTVYGAAQNNLQHIDVAFPVGLLTAVTGVSGSGKSSLVNGILNPVLATELNGAHNPVRGRCDRIEGIEHFDKVINIDQSPIGRTPRSNPATYTGVFTDIRDLFARTPDAQSRGYGPGRFSFNVSGGRCESCTGDGILKIEMHFLPDVYVTCDVCKGRRYNRETLEVHYKGKSIADVLEMTVEEACEFFRPIPRIYNKIKTLYDVGLGYIRLGQPATTLSGGEAQRVKLATELAKRSTGRTVYILDEPTTGLHAADVDKLILILQRLTLAGNTVIVIEHNLDVIKVADHIIDLGPEGGDGGGRIIFAGTPEQVAACPTSWTGRYLAQVLAKKQG
ncbi:MAG: excinuclease ABC subunit UvrA [Clostridia bacterium]|nr:excinuclease ABC subunit UvrA [Clostridia bacterium]